MGRMDEDKHDAARPEAMTTHGRPESVLEAVGASGYGESRRTATPQSSGDTLLLQGISARRAPAKTAQRVLDVAFCSLLLLLLCSDLAQG